MSKLYGFSFLKDGERFDYPYKEMLTCMENLVEKCYLALGKNDDGTSEQVKKFKKVEVIPTVWDMSKIGDGGLIFSEQTNIALNKLREDHQNEPEAWGIYLQSDEIIHEEDFVQLKRDIDEAEKTGCDAIRFRYFHFWMSHYQIAINKRWYPHEIRAVKIDSNVVSYGDAQGFSNFTKVFESDVHIFHYGHVRDQKKKEEKQKDLLNKIRPSEKFNKYLNREIRAFAKTKTLPIYIQHSLVMKNRIETMGESFFVKKINAVNVISDKVDENISRDKKVKISLLRWFKTKEEANKEKGLKINLNPSFFQKLFNKKKYISKMESNLAREWDLKTKIMVQLGYIENDRG
ncbi:hypothetical protein OAT67_04910 [Bacteriovoracaceae bacterium]|nr:hypothetical protein [Bacteriovoracaceae bacterium]